jgi:hypothetical protein
MNDNLIEIFKDGLTKNTIWKTYKILQLKMSYGHKLQFW